MVDEVKEWIDVVALPLVTIRRKSAVLAALILLRKTGRNGLNPASMAICAHQNGPSQSSTRKVTKFGRPRMTNGLRAAQTMLRQTVSSSPSSGPNTAVGIQS